MLPLCTIPPLITVPPRVGGVTPRPLEGVIPIEPLAPLGVTAPRIVGIPRPRAPTTVPPRVPRVAVEAAARPLGEAIGDIPPLAPLIGEPLIAGDDVLVGVTTGDRFTCGI